MKAGSLLLPLAACLVAAASAFRLPAAPSSPRLLPVIQASSLLQQQASVQLRGRSAALLPWGGALKAATTAAEGATSTSGETSGLKNWDPQQWIAPAFHNRGSVRLLAVLAGVAVAIHKTGVPVPRKVAAFVHLLSFGANLGAQLYTTFVLGIVMIKMLKRQTFGKLQSRLFPIYFGWSAVTLALQLLTGGVMGLGAPAMRCLGLSLAATFLNILYLEPQSTQVMFARYALEDAGKQSDPSYKQLAKEFGKFHGLSSLANLVALVGAFCNGWFLSLLLA